MLFRKRHQRLLQAQLAWEQTQQAIMDAIKETEDTVELKLCGCDPNFPGLMYGCKYHDNR